MTHNCPPNLPPSDRFNWYVDNRSIFYGDCIVYLGRSGGEISDNGRTTPIYRWVAREILGHDIERNTVRRTCKTNGCFNPAHLETIDKWTGHPLKSEQN